MSKYYAIDSHKMQYHLDKVESWKQGKGADVYPVYVEISPVGHCNHRCTFCAVDYIGYKNRALDTQNLCNNIAIMAENDVRSIMFAGEGEPMLHPDIGMITKFTSMSKIDVAFTTNGTAMTNKFLSEALGYITWIKVSLNAGDEETYAKIHRCPAKHFDMVWHNIANAVRLRDINGYKATIGVQCVLLPENAHTIDDLAKRCKDVGVDYLVIKPYSHHLSSETQQYRDIKYGQDYKILLETLSMYTSSNFEIITRDKSMEAWDAEDRGYTTCHSTPYMWAYVMASGDVYACSAHIGNDMFNLGNINDTNFDIIWRGEKRKVLIDKMLNGFDISTCRKNCRMDKVNRFMNDIKNPGEHKNFI